MDICCFISDFRSQWLTSIAFVRLSVCHIKKDFIISAACVSRFWSCQSF